MISFSFLPRILMFSLCLLLLAKPAAAEEIVSTAEDVAIAFFKTGKTNPDFDLWARKSPQYHTAAPAFAKEALDEEKQRLMRLWQTSKEKPLEIKTSVSIHLKSKLKEDGETYEYWMNIALPAMDPFYFPYTHYDYKFAVMPQKLETLTLHPLQEAQYELMRAEFEDKASGYADLYLQLVPVKAYINEPYKIDGEDQWALITDIASLSLKSAKNGSALWDYTAPWYLSPVKQNLENLYDDAPPK